MSVFILMLNLPHSDSVVSVYSSKDDADAEAKRLMVDSDLRYYVLTRDLI